MVEVIARRKSAAALLTLLLALGSPACVFQTDDDPDVEQPVEDEEDAEVETEVEVEDEATP